MIFAQSVFLRSALSAYWFSVLLFSCCVPLRPCLTSRFASFLNSDQKTCLKNPYENSLKSLFPPFFKEAVHKPGGSEFM